MNRSLTYLGLLSWAGMSVSLSIAMAQQSQTSSGCSARAWVEDTFNDFVDGTFDDGCAQYYVTAVGDLRAINHFDFNQDGAIDLVFCNTHATAEKPDTLIYWGDSRRFKENRVTPIATDGAFYNLVKDLNRDGWPELTLMNCDNGVSSLLESFVYWGGPKAYSHLWRSEFATFNPGRCVATDFNGDGFEDLVVPNGPYKLGTVSFDNVGVRIHWGSKEGYTDRNVLQVGGKQVSCVAVGRFQPSSEDSPEGSPGLFVGFLAGHSQVFLQGEIGLDTKHPKEIQSGPVSNAIAFDLNGDGLDELLFNRGPQQTILQWNPVTEELKEMSVQGGKDLTIADVDGDGHFDLIIAGRADGSSLITWGTSRGWSQETITTLQTVNASAVVATDIDLDGHIDVAVSQEHDGRTYDADTLVFWGNSQRGLGSVISRLPGHGTQSLATGDIDRDGKIDLVVTGRISGAYPSGHVPTYIYLNDGDGQFPLEKRSGIVTNDNYEAAAGDFNLDGFTDIVFAEQYETQGEIGNSHVYWGAADGLDPARRTGLPTHGPLGVSIADLNRDGYIDILFGQLDRTARPETGKPGGMSRIYWGSGDGFRDESFTELPSPKTGTPGIADFNRDGWLDIVFPNGMNEEGSLLYWGGPKGYDPERVERLCFSRSFKCEVADINSDGWLDLFFVVRVKGLSKDTHSLAYLGGPSGFSERHRLEFPSRGAGDASIADLNRDGLLDIVVTNYSVRTTRQLPFYIYWGSQSGWSSSDRTELPANSGNGTEIADFDADGWLDIAIACHRLEGSRDLPGHPNTHQGFSYVYFGAENGFDTRRRLSLPTIGPHGMLGVDLGHVYHRRGEWIYVSSVHKLDTSCRISTILWQGSTPDNTSIVLQFRLAESAKKLADEPWQGPQGLDSWFEQPTANVSGSVQESSGQFVQYRVRLQSPSLASYPSLDRVELRFQ
jgi:hypothetical protein